jgi:Flp pilus assembly protein TadG
MTNLPASTQFPAPSRLTARIRRFVARKQKGQSLIEFAVSAVVLVLLVSGIVDLGRAYFAKVAMDAIISEGAHWAAAFPGCIPTANNATGADYIPDECVGTNSVVGRMLNENKDLAQSRFTEMSFAPLTGVPGDTFTISVTYKMYTITPVIQALFGSSWSLTTEVKEVVRGSGKPNYAGTPMTAQGEISPVLQISDLKQPAACNAGMATITWTAVPSSGYRIYKGKFTAPPYPTPFDTITPGGTLGSTISWSYDINNPEIKTDGLGGSQDITVTSINDDNGTIKESAPSFITARCAPIQPTLASYTCQINGATFNWTMESKVDQVVTGYGIFRMDGGTPIQIATITGAGTDGGQLTSQTGSVTFSTAADRTKSYYVQALENTTLLASASNTQSIACGGGLTATYFDNSDFTSLKLTRVDPAIDFIWATGSPDVSIASDTYSVRWIGKVQPLYSETYTFYTDVDDGVRVWINGILVINEWHTHEFPPMKPQHVSLPINLVAGQKYDIKVEYFENTGNAGVKLYWSSSSQTKQIVPVAQLHP